MKKLPVIIFFLQLFTTGFAQSNDETVIRQILQRQENSWNNGNINGFMDTYWRSDSLMFIGKKGIVYGWQQTKNNYLKSYPDTTSMGKLSFELQEIKQLSDIYFFVVGKWHLTRSAGNIEGHFSLLIKKIDSRWLIVADHSS